VRLDSYFLRWLALAKVPHSFNGVRALMVKERYLATCHKSLDIFLRDRAVDDLEELAKLAEQFQDAHGTGSRFSYQKEHQSSSSQRQSVSSSSLSKPIGQDRIQSKQMVSPTTRQSKQKCYNCAKNCFQKAQVGAMVQRNQKPDTGFKPSYEQSSRRIVNRASSQQRVNEVENTEKLLIYCKSHCKAYCPECCTRDLGHVCNAMLGTDVELKCGCTAPLLAEACDLVGQLKANMPVADGKLNGQDVRVLRDIGCSTIMLLEED